MQVARRYDCGSLPPDSREHLCLVRGRFQAGLSLTGHEARIVMGTPAWSSHCPSILWFWHSTTWYTCATVAIHWHLLHGKLWGWCTHKLCTSSLHLQKKVALQPCICMGGPTCGLTLGPPCSILISTWQDSSINESLSMSRIKIFYQRRRRSLQPKFRPLSIAMLFGRLAWLLAMQCGR